VPKSCLHYLSRVLFASRGAQMLSRVENRIHRRPPEARPYVPIADDLNDPSQQRPALAAKPSKQNGPTVPNHRNRVGRPSLLVFVFRRGTSYALAGKVFSRP